MLRFLQKREHQSPTSTPSNSGHCAVEYSDLLCVMLIWLNGWKAPQAPQRHVVSSCNPLFQHKVLVCTSYLLHGLFWWLHAWMNESVLVIILSQKPCRLLLWNVVWAGLKEAKNTLWTALSNITSVVLLLPLTVVALLPDLASTTLCHSLWQRSSSLSLCYYRIRILFNERSEFVNFISNSIFWLSEKDSYVMLVQPLGSCLSRSWVVDPVFWGFMMYFWFMKLCSSVSSVVFTLLFVSPGLSLLSSL